jgi:predicted glycoside hydrolase/deacetylase ChbG (UPF0249 family)
MNKITKRVLILLIFILPIALIYFIHSRTGEIRLIVRGDDMGFSHAANLGCIKSYNEGILTAVEVMVPCDHFLEAVKMLKENPGLDIGIHLTLNSEWQNIRWGPITDAPSLVDKYGYFYPMNWPEEYDPPDMALGLADWKIEEIEQELRAQIETALSYLPEISHATPHMGFHEISPEVYQLTFQLMKEYSLDANIRMMPLRRINLFGDADNLDEMISNAVDVLENLSAGTWEVYDHPGMLLEDEEPHWHVGAENDAIYRDLVTKVLISDELKEVIERRNIKLVGYNDLKFWQ